MASVIEDAETYQQSSPMVADDIVPLTNPSSDLTARRSSAANAVRDGTSIIGTIFLVVNAALGAGLLNFPQAFDQAGGIEVAMIVQAVLVFFIILSLISLAKSSDGNGSGTVQAVLSGVCGPIGKHIGSVCVALYAFGTCVTFLIIIGDQFDRALASLYGPHFCSYWYMQREFLIVACSVIFILPLCFSVRIDFLKYVSPVGVFSIVYVIFIVIIEYYDGNYVPGPIKHHPDNWTEVFLVIPAICFGYQCHISAIPIYSCMKERNIKNFSLCVTVGIATCFTAYTIAGTFGYLTFGSSVPSDILQGYDASKPHVLIAIIALAAKSCATYPILAFCGREAITSMLQGCCNFSHPNGEKLGRIVVSLIWFVASMFLAILIPDIGEVIQILGSLAAIFIFVFPGVCLLQSILRKDPSMIRKKNLFYSTVSCIFIVVGVFLFGLVLTQAIIYQITAAQNEEPYSSLCNYTKLSNIRLMGA